jgi:Animal haem peroxidase
MNAIQESAGSEPRCTHEHVTHSEPRGHYSRLFERPAKPVPRNQEDKLIELGKAMSYEVEREGTLTPRVGYTYFGQFVGHDLTRDPTPLEGPYPEPELTPNYQTPYLDLDHIYGGGPERSPFLYEGERGKESFKIGATTPTGYLRDLPVEHGMILIGDLQDTRNLDNLILRQLHVVLLKFHNEAIRQLGSNPPAITGIDDLGSGTLFERAQRLVRWHYQWIIRHDFLPRILHTDVWRHQHRRPARHPESQESYSVPIEFSLAAFRFGHSMVRNAYRLNCRRKRVVIGELMALGQKASPIPDDYLIEWGTFFDGLPTSGPQASSSFIDTSISRAMHGLSPGTIRLSNRLEPPDPSNLPVRTLLRGARAGLPSGQEVAETLLAQGRIKSGDRLTTSQLTEDTCDRSGSVLRSIGLEQNTPLFYYLLKEAELTAEGLTLGPVGSHIVSEVIHGALEADPDSYMCLVGPKWNLPLWRFPSGSRRPINSLIGIVQVVGDDKLLPECEAHWRRFLLHPQS